MSEVVNIIDKFLKRKLKMNFENEQFWHREQDTVYGHAVYPVWSCLALVATDDVGSSLNESFL